MGIEPTNHNSRCSSTGFEDQARHQAGSTSLPENYTTAPRKSPSVRPFSNAIKDPGGRR